MNNKRAITKARKYENTKEERYILKKKEIIVQMEAATELADEHFAQLGSYRRAAGLQVRLLLNFSKPTLEIRRVIN